MRHTGILAHSPDGAALAFTEFCHLGQTHFGAPLHPDISLDYTAMGRALPDWDRGNIPAVRALLSSSIDRLARAGATFFFCPDNTAHIALESAGPDFAIPGLNIADVLAAEARANGCRRVGILGTRYTVAGPVYPRALGAVGLECMLPPVQDSIVIDQIIFDELVQGIFSDASRQKYIDVIACMAVQGCDAVALVCTEIPLLIGVADSPLPVLDSARLVAKAAFDVGVGITPMPTWRGGNTRQALVSR